MTCDCPGPLLKCCNEMIYSDPGQDNFWPLWDDNDGQITEAMKSLTEHSEGWAQSCTLLLSALSPTCDGEIRRDIAICIGQQNKETRTALIQAGARRVLKQAMAKTADPEARYMLDFATRSLAPRSDGRSPAVAPSKAKLPTPARAVAAAFFVRGASVAAKAVAKKAGSVENAVLKKAPAKQSALTAAKGKAVTKGKAAANGKAAAAVKKAPAAAKRIVACSHEGGCLPRFGPSKFHVVSSSGVLWGAAGLP
jgi:hypothetical protein